MNETLKYTRELDVCAKESTKADKKKKGGLALLEQILPHVVLNKEQH